jgi:hypothetical protein
MLSKYFNRGRASPEKRRSQEILKVQLTSACMGVSFICGILGCVYVSTLLHIYVALAFGLCVVVSHYKLLDDGVKAIGRLSSK